MKLISSNIIGQGRKNLIILHGFLGMGDNWKNCAIKFSNIGFKVHLIDQRNHGRSFWDKQFNYKIKNNNEFNKLQNLIILIIIK